MAYDNDYDVGSEDLGEYVPVVYARSLEEAEKYRQVLEDHDIPAVVDEEYEPGEPGGRRQTLEGVPVLVPESLLEDARQFISEIDGMAAFADEDEDIYDDEDDDDDFALEEDFEEEAKPEEPTAGPSEELEEEDVEEDLEEDQQER
jgi:hypothetical protein